MTQKLIDQMQKIADERGMERPQGLKWGIRSVRPDLTSRNGFRWAFPGNWIMAKGPFDTRNSGGCPTKDGDGICIANNWQGMAGGQIPAITLLLVGYRTTDVLGIESDNSKLRVKEAYVRDIIDGTILLISFGYCAHLYGANLRSAYLYGADLYGANLRSANLHGAYLYGANLYGANLSRASLRSANLRTANLRNADLYGADLYGADLHDADLYGANLYGADLHGADLHDADLRSANLHGAINLDKAYGYTS